MTRRLLDEGQVTLRLDRRRLDQHQRVLAYVFVDGRMLNTELVRAGLARTDIFPGDSQSIGRTLNKAEAEAQSNRVGIWERQNGRRIDNRRGDVERLPSR